ncbi:MAG: DUF4340 domain-containing protein [Candidatus Omnitrophota bacterium]
MKPKQIIILLILLAALIAVLFIKKVLIKPEIETDEYQELGLSLDASGISAFEISKGSEGETLRIEKRAGQWLVASKWDAKANTEKVEELFNNMSSIKGELRSSLKELLSDYDISDDQAYSVAFYNDAGQLKQRLFIGAKMPLSQKAFLRKEGAVEVYLVDKDLFALLGITSSLKAMPIKMGVTSTSPATAVNPRVWMDLPLMKFDVEKADSLKLTRLVDQRQVISAYFKKVITQEAEKEEETEKEGEAEKEEANQWASAGDKPMFPIDGAKVGNFIKALSTMSGVQIVDPSKDYGLNVPYLTVEVSGEDIWLEIILGDMEDENGGRYARTTDGFVYTLSNFQVEELDVDTGRFFADNLLGVNKENLKSVIVREGDKVVSLNEALIEKNSWYIDNLTRFSIERTLFEKRYSQGLNAAPDYSLSITKNDGSSLSLDVVKEEIKGEDWEEPEINYFAQFRGNRSVFKIDEYIFGKLFYGIDRFEGLGEEKENNVSAPAEIK